MYNNENRYYCIHNYRGNVCSYSVHTLHLTKILFFFCFQLLVLPLFFSI